jgi:YesN/AraC family two-component response regulator
VAGIFRGVSANEEEYNTRIEENFNLISQLMNCRSILEMKEIILKLITDMIVKYNPMHEKKTNQLCDIVKSYVHQHYADPLLSFNTIADISGKSPYYVSKMFKMSTGSGLLDYINKVRINEAKLLLLNEKMTQDQVAERVGFTNVRTFQRVYKRVEGISPGKYNKPTVPSQEHF